MVRLSSVFALLLLIAATASAHSVVDVGMSIVVPQFVPVGQPFTYRVIADDRANDNGLGIVVTIVLPAQVKFSNIVKTSTWNCIDAHPTITCSADQIGPGPNPIDINVVAPATTTSLHATAKVESIASLDFNPSNDNATADIVAYQASLCTAAAPELTSPPDDASASSVVPLTWNAVADAQSYTILTSVEGAAAAPAMTSTSNAASLVAEPGTSEWWVVANFATCPPLASSHWHFTAATTLPRPVRIYAGNTAIAATHDNPIDAATFRTPYGLALSPNGELYVSDQADNVVRRVADGVVTTISGITGQAGSTDGQFALYRGPRGLAVTPLDGYVYAADTLNHEVRILYTGGSYVTAFEAGGQAGTAGYVDDYGVASRFNAPSGVAATERGSLYVADTTNNRIRKMVPVPTFVGFFGVSTVASGLHGPLGVAVDASDQNVFIADTQDGSVRRIDGSVLASGFDHPTGIALDARGNLFVTEGTSVRRIAPSGLVTTVASGFNSPTGIVVDPSDRIFVADSGSHTIRIIDLPQIVSPRRRAAH
jgi:DNA-binding beta-propeller fold protein YncE